MPEDSIILVNLKDEQVGKAGKLEVHQKGLLHRAFSVFIYQGRQILLQKRAEGKYHSAGLWANTCCSHPRDGEALKTAVGRRLWEEAGIRCEMKEIHRFVYREVFENGLTEFELDHVFIGAYHGAFTCNREEAQEMRYMDMDLLAEDMVRHPHKFSAWFITAFPVVYDYLNMWERG